MAIFNSLGSNYKAKHLIHMFTGFDPRQRDAFVEYLKDRYDANVQLTYKGREALYLALKNSKLKEGDHVAVNGYTCYAVYDAVEAAGMVPVYLDVEENSLNFGLAQLKQAHKKDKKLRAVIVQNTLGFPADIAGIEKFAHKNKMHLIEDLAHSIGMRYHDGREAGTVADAALSFSQDKAVDAVSGGAYVYRGKVQEFITKHLGYGKFLKDYYYIWNTQFIRSGYVWGGGKFYNFILRKLRWLPKPMDGAAKNVRRPDTWHATLAFKQFKDLGKTIAHRREIAKIYDEALPKRIKYAFDDNASYLRYPLRVSDPASLIKHLKSKGIYISDTWYEAPVSPARSMSKTNYESGRCPLSEQVASRMINLPTHVNVDAADAEKITERINQWLSTQE
ncbi:MAG: aminotransferase class I/II-fold pyridoxal phosphate-dependent enzyme [Actinomycetia bacterium]|nr:aminotransferase class I/II-fold pyridoxal phosphate-dependent enzyme [Actinomycetes bacterium]